MKMLKPLVPLFLLIITSYVTAQNPICPPGVYIADPSAHVWTDGKLYVYGSRDESPDYYCSYDHWVLATNNLSDWEITKDAFASRGSKDQVSYSDAPLYAPDCQYFNGNYYLYYCLAGGADIEGYAVSASPTGPFINGKPIKVGGYNQIDPAVFIDDDGQGYYIWGQFEAKIAKLKPGMTEIDESTIKVGVVNEKEHFFHEGGYMVKRNGIYYFIYTDISRANRATSIGYAMSDSPMGPFRYGGVIVDNDHCDPETWNNHGSIAEFKGKWYIFYHRSTHGSKMMRKVCIEPITFREDGTIPEVEMTSQGAGEALDAFAEIEAERACLLFGNVRIAGFGSQNEALIKINNDDAACYKYINFGTGASSVLIKASPGPKPVRIELALGQSWGQSLGSIEIPGNGDGTKVLEYRFPVRKIAGIHALWLRFYGDNNQIFCVDSFHFEK